MKLFPTAFALLVMVACVPAYADVAKCKARDGSLTYTDTSCHAYGRQVKLKLRDTSTYSSAEVTTANLVYANQLGNDRQRRDQEAAAEQRAADAQLIAVRAASAEKDRQRAKLDIKELPPMDFDHSLYTIPNKKP